MDLRKMMKRVVRFSSVSTSPAPPEFSDARLVALRFRAECAEHGPEEIAAAVGAPAEINGMPEDQRLRVIAYLFAHAVAPEDVRELCVEQGVFGFGDWVVRQRG